MERKTLRSTFVRFTNRQTPCRLPSVHHLFVEEVTMQEDNPIHTQISMAGSSDDFEVVLMMTSSYRRGISW